MPTLPDENSSFKQLRNIHWGPLIAAILLSIIGLATIQSASAELATNYMPKQALRLAIGLFILLWIFIVDYHVLVDFSLFLYLGGLCLLVLVLFIGHEAGGARSWLVFGPLTLQPSEFSKVATALLITRYLSRIQSTHLNLREIFTTVGIVAVPVVLIVLERDLGSAAMFMPMLAGLLLVRGIRWQHLAAAGALGILFTIGFWNFGIKDYQRQRIVSFMSPESDPLGAGYQARQSKIAVGSGQVFGRGYGQGTQSQLRFLPARHTDFVIAVLAEEWGFVGVMVVLGLYALFLLSAARIATRARDQAGLLVIVGVISVIAFHIVYNTGMVVGLLPITGIPLPFLSYGGSFTLVNFMTTGLILNVDYRRYVNR